jgi:hypothetical protein
MNVKVPVPFRFSWWRLFFFPNEDDHAGIPHVHGGYPRGPLSKKATYRRATSLSHDTGPTNRPNRLRLRGLGPRGIPTCSHTTRHKLPHPCHPKLSGWGEPNPKDSICVARATPFRVTEIGSRCDKFQRIRKVSSFCLLGCSLCRTTAIF